MLSIRLLAILTATIAIGCMQTDPAGEKGGEPDQELPLDNSYRAGATSSTNWPTDIGGSQNAVFATADSVLSIQFMKRGTVSEPVFIPVKLSGVITLYKGGTVPSLQPTLDTSITFNNADTILLSNGILSSLLSTNDTLYFNLNFRIETIEAWIFGLGYSNKTKMFFKTPLSIETENRVLLRTVDVAIKGSLDKATLLPKPSLNGISVLSFYIPGSPYHKVALGDSLELGPIADGEYPLRLLRTTYAVAGESGTLVEAFEVVSTKADTTMDRVYVFKPGALVFTFLTKATLSLRPDWHR